MTKSDEDRHTDAPDVAGDRHATGDQHVARAKVPASGTAPPRLPDKRRGAGGSSINGSPRVRATADPHRSVGANAPPLWLAAPA